MSDHLVGAAEVARILGVSRQHVIQLASEAADFPAAQAILGGGRVWNRNAVEGWAASHPDRGPPYRPAATPVGALPRDVGQILRLATDEARHLHHDWVGPDHLLLALLHPHCPGAARDALASFNLSLEAVRVAFVENMGDPFEVNAHGWLTTPPATQLVLERANLKAFELVDEEVTSQHVLLALIDQWRERGTPAYLAKHGVDADTVVQRVVAMTEETGNVPETPAPAQPRVATERRVPRPPEPDLALTPSGRDPRRRQPWGSAVFHDEQGRPVKQGIALRQYFVDRDGNPVLTTDGRPVHVWIDNEGRHILDEAGQPIVVPVEIPPRSAIRRAAKG